jgi:large subunit ribosomal protein L5
MQRLRQKYIDEVSRKLAQEFGISNPMAVPRITKIVVNVGVGDTLKDKSLLDAAINDIAAITGQKPSVRKAKVSVASFGIRRGMNVGLKVTLRGDRMYAFLDKLISVVLPRLRDFRGVSAESFDRAGNYTLGILEHSVFPEVDIAKTHPRGMEITVVTNAGDPTIAYKLLEYMGMPFEKK